MGLQIKGVKQATPFQVTVVDSSAKGLQREIRLPVDSICELLHTTGPAAIELLEYMLNSQYPVFRLRPDDVHHLDEVLQPVTALHDPSPHERLKLGMFDSLEKMQWHLLRHGFIDRWVYESQAPPTVLNWRDDAEIQGVWKDFFKIIECPRWGLNFHNKRQQATDSWKRNLQKYAHNKQGDPISGCHDCIETNGINRFIDCLRFFEAHRAQYLERIKNWITNTIVDQPCREFYETGEQGNFIPKRKHVHIKARTDEVLRAYVKEPKIGSKIDVFVMIFKLIASGRASLEYKIKTVYGLKRAQDEREADINIWADAHSNFNSASRQYQRVGKTECHPSNWQ